MKIFVPVFTFFKTYIHVMDVKKCKLDEIGVKTSLSHSAPPLPGWGEGEGEGCK